MLRTCPVLPRDLVMRCKADRFASTHSPTTSPRARGTGDCQRLDSDIEALRGANFKDLAGGSCFTPSDEDAGKVLA